MKENAVKKKEKEEKMKGVERKMTRKLKEIVGPFSL